MIKKTIRGKTIMDKELADILFREVIDVLNDVCCVYWLEYGTLLGAVREGDFLKNDHDIDIGLVADDSELEIIVERLRKKGIWMDVSYFGKYARKINKLIYGTGDKFAKIELVIGYRDGLNMNRLMEYRDGILYGSKTPIQYYSDLETMYFKDRFVNIPSEPEKLLEYYYGDWKTPREDIPSTYKNKFVEIKL